MVVKKGSGVFFADPAVAPQGIVTRKRLPTPFSSLFHLSLTDRFEALERELMELRKKLESRDKKS